MRDDVPAVTPHAAPSAAPDLMLVGQPGTTVTRRLAVAGGLASVAGLAAACAVGGSDPTGASEAGAAGSDAAAAGGSAGSSAGLSTGGSVSSATTAADATSGIVALDQVPVGGAVAVTIDGAPAVVARPTDSAVAAFSARCTHMGCTVAVAGAKLRCPCHGSQFDALTGAVLNGPATQNLPAITVHLDGEEVVAG